MADPQSLGPYRIVRRVGAGGMGVVYEAVHTGLDKRVALKVLPREVAADLLGRFLREARTAAGLHHTNIVPVFDIGQVDGVPYFAMQFIDGRPLDTFQKPRPAPPDDDRTAALEEPDDRATQTLSGETADHVPIPDTPTLLDAAGPALSPRRVAEFGRQAAEGLAHAHERGVVHRDVKPSNLILDDSGVVWVADFGLAFRSDDTAMTADGSILGTPRYMSPEQAQAKKTDARTDVYSLGVTLYELLTGAVAFPGDTPMNVIRRVIGHTPPRIRALNRAVPADLETVVTKAMAKRPEDRYPTGRELADDLRRFLNHEPVKARRISAVGHAVRWVRRNPVVAGLMGAVLLVFALGAGFSAHYAKLATAREHLANRNAAEAAWNADQAVQRAVEAEAATNTALAAEGRNRHLLYAARVNLAGVAVRERNYSRAADLLRLTLPAAGGEDLRGWEWHYLWRRVFTETRRVPLPGTGKLVVAGPTRFVRFDPDTRAAAVFDSDTLKPVASATVPPGEGLHWDSDGKRVGVVTAGRVEFAVFDLDRGAVAARLPLGGKGVADAALAPNGRLALRLAGSTPAGYDLWDAGLKKPRRLDCPDLPEAGSQSAFSPDNRFFAAWSETQEYMWNARSGERIHESPDIPSRGAFRASGPAVVFGRKGKVVVMHRDGGMLDGFVLTDTRPKPDANGRVELEYFTPEELDATITTPIDRVALDPSGNRLAVLDRSRTLTVYPLDDEDGEPGPVVALGTHGPPLRALHVRPGGTRVFGYAASELLEWDLTRGPVVDTGPPGLVREPSAETLTPDGRWAARAGARDPSQVQAVEAWDRTSDSPRVQIPNAGAAGERLTFQWAAGGRLVVGGSFGPAKARVPSIWSVDVPKTWEMRVDSPVGVVERARFTPCGRWILAQGATGWAALDPITMQVKTKSTTTRTGIAPLVDGRAIVLEPDGGGWKLTLWNLASGKPESTCAAGTGFAPGVPPVVDPKGKWAAAVRTAAGGSELVVFDLSTPSAAPRVVPLGAATGGGPGVVSADGSWAAIALDREVAVFETGGWARRHSLPVGGRADRLDLTPDGRLIAAGSNNSHLELTVWNPATGQELVSDQTRIGEAVGLGGSRYHISVVRGGDTGGLEILDGTPVPDALARERLGVK